MRWTLEERFWSKVDKSAGESACWPWMAARSQSGNGYGQIAVGKRRLLAHRLAWELANGRPLAEGMNGCHRCDNKGCCNPAHIFEGSQSDNIRDAVTKGRAPQNALHKTCLRGHPLEGHNVYLLNGIRFCRACKTIRQREYRHRKNALQQPKADAPLPRSAQEA